MFKKATGYIFLICSIVLFTFIFSCDVGLGESVDTYPPKLTLDYPLGDSLVIRDTFVMKGSTDDETKVTSVKITFTPTESSAVPSGFSKTYTAEIDPVLKKWNCSLNCKVEGKYEIPDGEYQVSIVATDSAKRTTNVTRVYKIDNTSPFVVIKRPVCDDSYGRTFKITGDISDENLLGTLEFTPYLKNGEKFSPVIDENGNQVKFAQNNISGNGYEAIVARFYTKPVLSEEEQVLMNRYKAMFNSDNLKEKKTLYYSVKVNDKAVSYPGDGVVEDGNISEFFYIYDDIYSDIYSDSSSTGKNLGLTNKQLVQILNGNMTGQVAADALEALGNHKYECDPVESDEGLVFQKAVDFSISPDNSPTYQSSGYEFKNSGSSHTTIMNNGSVTISVSPGRDGYSLVKNSIRVLLKEAVYDAGINSLKEKTDGSTVVLLEAPEIYEAEGYSGIHTPDEWDNLRKNAISANDANLMISTTIGDRSAGTYYLLVVTGRDQEDNVIEPYEDKVYGFDIYENLMPPTVKILSTTCDGNAIENSAAVNSTSISLAGEVSTSTKNVSVECSISVTDGNGSDVLYSRKQTLGFEPSSAGWIDTTHGWNFSLSDADRSAISALEQVANPSFTKGLYQITISFEAMDYKGNKSANAVSRLVILDTEKPVLSEITISPTVTFNDSEEGFVIGREYVNGIIDRISSTATDNYQISRTEYVLEAVESNGTRHLISSGSSTGSSVSIVSVDTTVNNNAYDDCNLEIAFTVYDKAGNSSVKNRTVYIDQDTDKPVIKITNADKLLNDENLITTEKNLFDLTANSKIRGSFTDDDGLKSVDIKWKKLGQADSEYKSLSGYPKNTGSTTDTIDAKLLKVVSGETKSLEEGVYSLKVIGIDKNNIEGSAVFLIGIDDKDPALSITTENDKFRGNPVTVEGSVSDSSGKVTLFRNPSYSVKDGVVVVDASKSDQITVNNDGSFKDIFNPGDSGRTVTYTAYDKYGKSGTRNFAYKIDLNPPVLDDLHPLTVKAGSKSVLVSALTDETWFNDKNVTISGGVIDENDISSIVMTLNGTETQFSGAKEFNLLSEYAQGTNSIKLKVIDIALNPMSKDIAVKVDSVPPNLTSVSIDGKSQSNFVTAADSITLNLTADDATSGLSKVLVGTTPSFSESSAKLNAPYSESISLDVASWAEGSYTLYVRVTDKAGLSSGEVSVSGLVIDRTAPSITYTSHSDEDTVNKSIVLSGSCVELNRSAAPEPVLYYRTSALGGTLAGSWVLSGNSVSVDSKGDWSVPVNTTTLVDGKKYDFQIRMKDAANNVTAETGAFRTLNVDQNSDRPIVKLNFTTDGTARLNSGTFSGNITDDDGDVKSLSLKAVPDSSSFAAVSWISLKVTGGSWEIPEANKLSDGNYKLYFKVTDAKGQNFTTSEADGLDVPYIQYSSSAKVYAPVTFSVDTTAPTISLVDVSLNNGSYANTNIQNNKILGGKVGKTVIFKIEAADTVSKGDNLAVSVEIAGTVYPATYGGAANKFYYTDSIDLSAVESGIYQLSVKAIDQAGMPQSFTKMVIIDNTHPDTIKNVSPSSTTEVTGDFEMTGLVQDDENANSGIPMENAMWYYIPKYSERNTTGDTNLEKLAWTREKLVQSSVSWSIALGDLDKVIGYNSETETVGSNYSGYVVAGNSALYDIPVWFKVVDNAGNVGYITTNKLHFNPNADKPTIEITYPGETEKEDGKIVMGGIARIQGAAGDNEGIDAVYVQFDMNGDGTYENGVGIAGAPKNTSGKVYAGGDTSNVATTIPIVGGTGFKAKGTLSWSTSIDLSGITMAEGKTFNVRAIAIDNNGGMQEGRLASAWTEVVNITVNNEIPQITETNLVQYTDSTYTTVSKQIKYEDDIFLSGSNWRLEGSVAHKDGINAITSTGTTSTVIMEKNGTTATFKIPVNVSSGSWNINLSVVDNGTPSHTKNAQYSVNIDNLAPDFVDGESGEIVLYKNAYGVAANKLSSSVYLENNNGSYATIASKLHEAGSGFHRAVFYFYKTGVGGNRIYNVMSSSDNKVVVTSGKAAGSVYFNDEQLPVLRATVTRPDKTTLNLTTNSNIRIGGLVKIGGAYHKIADVTESSVSLESTDEVATKFTDAEFVYAMVVDNSGESMKMDGFITGDDGDGMVETFAKSGSNIQWDASIPSANIPDGPVQIHVVVFDKAGNSAHDYVTTRLSNNAPRITSVKLATDLNGNGTYEASEYEKFYALSNQNTSSGVEIWNLDTKKEMGTDSRFTVKQGLSVIPEFVGGIAPFKYTFTKSATDVSLSEAVKTTMTVVKKGELFVVSTDPVTGAITTSSIDLTSNEIDSTKTAASGEDKDMTYQFSFWDSTEETTAGVDSSWTVLNAKIHQDLSDSNAPVGHIHPFYWHSAKNNSLVYDFENDKGKIETSEIAGHIELEDDWTKQKAEGGYYTSYDGNASGTQFDADPKVSGNIVLRGLIYDDVRLGSFSVTFADFGTIKISEYNTQSKPGDWSDFIATDKIVYAKVQDEFIGQNGHLASYEVVLNTDKIAGHVGIDKTVTIKVVDAAGRTYAGASSEGQTKETVTATYYATNAQIKTKTFYTSESAAKAAADGTGLKIANPDMTLSLVGETSKNSGIYKYSAHSRTGFYRMDVVPYVTGLGTTLSRIERKNASVYGRTALGKYPVYYYTKNASDGAAESEVITVQGYNISGATVTMTGTGATAVLDGSDSFSLPEAAMSGKLSIKVAGIQNLNNQNYDNAVGMYDGGFEDDDYAYCYNRMPNGQNNNLLTDDLEIAIWGVNSRSAKTSGEAISEVTMHVNPADGKLGFGFAFGNYASYPYGVNANGNAQTNSYYRWSMDYTPINTVRFIYDSQGHMFGVHAGTDTNAPRNARFRLTSSLWGINSNFSSNNDWNCAYSANNALRLEYMGNYQDSKAVLNGTRFLYHPQLAASVKSSTNMTNLYLMYYDSMTNELRFRAGAIANNKGFTNHTSTGDGKDNSGMFTKSSMVFGDFQDDAYRRSDTPSSQVTNYDHVSVLASSATAASGFNPGQRYSIAVVPDVSVGGNTVDVVIAVWHDPITRTLWYSYMVDPLTNNHQNVNSTTHVNSSWKKPKAILDATYSGGYCAVAVDEYKHVHIASYSKENTGSLIYTYLDSYNSMDADGFDVKKTSAVVDSYGTTGQNLTIDFAKDEDGHTIPYIGYYLASLQYPKYAYLVDTTSSDRKNAGAAWAPKDGCDGENLYTGVWESVILPTQSDFIVDDFYIGVYRGTNGKLNNIPKITESLGGTSGSCGGNGTSNPVLGYGINYGGTGYVETAQLK